ncbi:thioredoxin-dependent thiol peroxidase [Luethyella okanaganae]|uniref:thioredoxin-dependent peroxiredoxin n=1 Tax=Luethyella okanaganae TaxID=69372 RepID=A0ABW1VDD0_9MICO
MTETTRLEAGDTAPPFTLGDQDGAPVSLGDFAGRKVIVYFYPEAMTPGCTTQACDFRDNLNSLASAGYQVLGISQDAPAKLKEFEEVDSVNFPLLSDEDRSVHDAYGTWGEKNLYGRIVTGTLRSTFVIDEHGVIALALYNVKATGHVAMLRKRLGIDAAA